MLVVGLGNPGNKYSNTKHNFGFWIIDKIIENRSLKLKTGKGNYLYAKDREVILAKPTTYMNNSGIAVSEICSYFKISINNVIVVYDDIDLGLGKMKFKLSGSSGGHRGIESILYHLKSEKFHRLRLGISTKDYIRPAEKYVLKPFPEKYNEDIIFVINRACEALSYFIDNGIEKSMNKFNNNKEHK